MVVLFDLNHVAYRCLFSVNKDIPQVGWAYFKHAMFNTIFSLCTRFEADEVVLMVDSKENWRKKIHPEYKENRKESRDKQTDIDWNAFFTAFREFVDEVKTYFPFYVLQVKYLEADDIAGILAREWQHKKKIIVTSDGDYLQLLKYNNIQLFDPIKNKFNKCDDPVRQLKMKILMGDKGDNIPSIKPRVGEVTAARMVDNPDEIKALFEDKTVSYVQDGKDVTMGDEYKERYKKNMILIDLNKTPDVFVKLLMKTIKEYQMPTGKEIFQYFSKNKFRDLMSRMDQLDKIILRINEAKANNPEVIVPEFFT
jgi:5'-3' exonuclease